MTAKQNNIPLEMLEQLRKKLHMHAELSGNEIMTRNILRDFLSKNATSGKIVEIGKTGLALIFEGKNPGPCIMFRAETDALPINDDQNLTYKSVNTGISHKCGHDGHATVLCGLACLLEKQFSNTGTIILLFQPAEETGKGADEMLADPLFESFTPDYVFALHNLPGFDAGSVIVKKEQFASASKGMIIKLIGKPSHAAYPEQGNNPAFAFTEIIQGIECIPDYPESFDSFILTTIVHASLGKPGFGTAAGEAVIMATLRSYDNHNIQRLVHESRLIVEEKAKEHNLQHSIEWSDEFDETFNHPVAVDIIEKVATENKLKIIHLPFPFRWSEDFGRYTSKYKGAMFGLGAGKEHPALHTKNYDFPDEIILKGIEMFLGIIQEINSNELKL